MTTLVGTQESFTDAVKSLIELDYDAIEAYETAKDYLENREYQEKMEEFKADHQRHVRELSLLLEKHGEKAPEGVDMKHLLTKGKVMLANLIGDKTIISAMLSNEDDTNTAYERMSHHESEWNDARDIINRGLADEQRHKAWLEKVVAD